MDTSISSERYTTLIQVGVSYNAHYEALMYMMYIA